MISLLDHLTDEEQSKVYNAPILIAILVAGADGTIDDAELRMAKSVSKLKKKIDEENLTEYYELVGQNLEDKLKVGINRLPADPEERKSVISSELYELNSILPKVDKTFAIKYYESLKDFAMQVAKASGGLLGFKSIGNAEAELIKLEMIKNPETFNEESQIEH